MGAFPIEIKGRSRDTLRWRSTRGRVTCGTSCRSSSKKAIEVVKMQGGENVTLLVTVIGGQQTNVLRMLVTAENWTKFGQIQEAVYDDLKMQELMVETGGPTWRM
jgi:hypothetical protein